MENLAWEYDSRIILKDERTFRTVVYLGVRTLLVGVVLLANATAQIPLHRGNLTIPQFCFTEAGVTVACDVEMQGYHPAVTDKQIDSHVIEIDESLYDQALITREEYEQKKKEILNDL